MSRRVKFAVGAVLFIAAQVACSLGGYTLSPVDAGDGGGGAQPADAGGGDSGSAATPGALVIAAGPPTPTPYVYDGPAPAAGTGIVVGRLLWNGLPVVGNQVKVCAEIKFIGGCEGEEYATVTDDKGVYVIKDVPAGEWGLAFLALDAEGWQYVTSGFINAAGFDVTDGAVTEVGDMHISKQDMTLVSPADEAVLSEARPTITWAAYPEAAYYEVSLSGQKGQYLFLGYETTETSLTAPADLQNCEYHWSIEAYNASGIQIAETDGLWYFDIIDQPYACEITGLSPADGASASAANLTLTWDAHGLAAVYKIHLYNADDSSVKILDFVETTTNSYAVTQTIPAGTYEWVVYYYDATDELLGFSDNYTLYITSP
ncbi:MAG: hypothetical protein EPO32_04660 [Anaerolineae bacterium]|nr:MAG: hypothetical protein EPO32_04660 [Anaerolineae bacterium]